ncbi:MAG: hypothetical protein FJZ58_04730, partial [Chlamydiae bacterium]|nr:hypothetical protein [Chlamydiota bacterium]
MKISLFHGITSRLLGTKTPSSENNTTPIKASSNVNPVRSASLEKGIGRSNSFLVRCLMKNLSSLFPEKKAPRQVLTVDRLLTEKPLSLDEQETCLLADINLRSFLSTVTDEQMNQLEKSSLFRFNRDRPLDHMVLSLVGEDHICFPERTQLTAGDGGGLTVTTPENMKYTLTRKEALCLAFAYNQKKERAKYQEEGSGLRDLLKEEGQGTLSKMHPEQQTRVKENLKAYCGKKDVIESYLYQPLQDLSAEWQQVIKENIDEHVRMTKKLPGNLNDQELNELLTKTEAPKIQRGERVETRSPLPSGLACYSVDGELILVDEMSKIAQGRLLPIVGQEHRYQYLPFSSLKEKVEFGLSHAKKSQATPPSSKQPEKKSWLTSSFKAVKNIFIRAKHPITSLERLPVLQDRTKAALIKRDFFDGSSALGALVVQQADPVMQALGMEVSEGHILLPEGWSVMQLQESCVCGGMHFVQHDLVIMNDKDLPQAVIHNDNTIERLNSSQQDVIKVHQGVLLDRVQRGNQFDSYARYLRAERVMGPLVSSLVDNENSAHQLLNKNPSWCIVGGEKQLYEVHGGLTLEGSLSSDKWENFILHQNNILALPTGWKLHEVQSDVSFPTAAGPTTLQVRMGYILVDEQGLPKIILQKENSAYKAKELTPKEGLELLYRYEATAADRKVHSIVKGALVDTNVSLPAAQKAIEQNPSQFILREGADQRVLTTWKFIGKEAATLTRMGIVLEGSAIKELPTGWHVVPIAADLNIWRGGSLQAGKSMILVDEKGLPRVVLQRGKTDDSAQALWPPSHGLELLATYKKKTEEIRSLCSLSGYEKYQTMTSTQQKEVRKTLIQYLTYYAPLDTSELLSGAPEPLLQELFEESRLFSLQGESNRYSSVKLPIQAAVLQSLGIQIDKNTGVIEHSSFPKGWSIFTYHPGKEDLILDETGCVRAFVSQNECRVLPLGEGMSMGLVVHKLLQRELGEGSAWSEKPEERRMLLQALRVVRDPILMKRYLSNLSQKDAEGVFTSFECKKELPLLHFWKKDRTQKETPDVIITYNKATQSFQSQQGESWVKLFPAPVQVMVLEQDMETSFGSFKKGEKFVCDEKGVPLAFIEKEKQGEKQKTKVTMLPPG